jgi:uncharacterized protein (DUF2236 family)
MALAPPALPFGPDTVSWKVNREPIVLALGGPRAGLLQVAHPKVAAGVADHSDYKTDPFGRGSRTIDWLLKIQFGERPVVEGQADLFARMHRRVEGTTSTGDHYHALDPDLLLWVWATLVDSFAMTYDRFVAPLGRQRRARYYEEQKLWAYACGVPEGGCPETWADLQRYMERMIAEELVVGPVTRDVAAGAAPFFQPPFSAVLRLTDSFLWAALLPPSLRKELDLGWGVPHEVVLRSSSLVSRAGVRVVPRRLRHASTQFLVERKEPLDVRPPRRIRKRVA